MDSIPSPIHGSFILDCEKQTLSGWAVSKNKEPVIIAVESNGQILTLLTTSSDSVLPEQTPPHSQGFAWRIPTIITDTEIERPLRVWHLNSGKLLVGPDRLPAFPSCSSDVGELLPAAEPFSWPHGLAAAAAPGLIEVATGFWLLVASAAQGVRFERAAPPDAPDAPQWGIRVILAAPASLALHQRIPSCLLPQVQGKPGITLRLFIKLSHALDVVSQSHVEIAFSRWNGHTFERIRRIRRSRVMRQVSSIDFSPDMTEEEAALQRRGELILTVELPSSPGAVFYPVVPQQATKSTELFEDGRLDGAFKAIGSLTRGHGHVVSSTLLPPDGTQIQLMSKSKARAVPFTQIILPVYNGAEVVRDCLASVQSRTDTPFQLLIVDDGSRGYTARMLEEFSMTDPRFILHRRDINRGYTKSINEAIKLTSAEWVVILNSDTVVSQGWLRKLHAATHSQERVGMVGPLSNAATWQSVPQVKNPDGSWSTNDFIAAHHVPIIQERLEHVSERGYPTMPILNGFATLISRRVFDTVGLFDEEAFPVGYGEETDMCLRAGRAGFKLVVADDCFVYHQKSVSFGSATRAKLSRAGTLELRNKHVGINIAALERSMQQNSVMVRLRTELAGLAKELT